MAKLTINDVEYDTDDFTEEQGGLYNQILLARDEMARAELNFKALEATSNAMAGQIEKLSNAEPADEVKPEDG
tara:strand:- start:687 stop:905 length:219 start_codon:yes stop_codon:yes gene_type:complete